MTEDGIKQTTLCRDLGFTEANFSAFLTGKKSFPTDKVFLVLKYLGLQFSDQGTVLSPDTIAVREYIKGKTKERKMSQSDIATKIGADISTVSRYFSRDNGLVLLKYLERLFLLLNITIKKKAS